jgi:GGDEF domain-containing protein
MPPVPPRRRRARPVADAPIDSLLLRSEELTKGWLLALLEEAPLEEAAGILAADLTRDGPRLCEAVLRALVSDTDLRRLEPVGALRPLAARAGELAGAATPVATSRAVDALQAVVWSAVRDELRRPDPDMVSEVSERLTLIGELLRAAALEQPEAAIAPAAARSEPARPGPTRPAPVGPAPARPAPVRAEPVHPGPARPGPVGPGTAQPEAGHSPSPRPASWPAEPTQPDAGDPLWVGALEDEIRHSAGAPLSLLLAELEDADRVLTAQAPTEASDIFNRFAGAVRSVVRRQDILVSESEVRAWIIARDTGRGGAYALGQRIAAAVRESDRWHDVPLNASVGVAVLGEDGRTSSELMDAAEEARFAAAASGLHVLPAQPPGNGESPPG